MNSSESSLAAAAAKLVGHTHEIVHVLLVQAPRATMLSCHRLFASKGFIPSRLLITGGNVSCSVLFSTVFDSARSKSGTSTWFNTMFVDWFSLCDGAMCVIFLFSIFSGFWKNSGIILTKFNFFIVSNPKIRSTLESSAIRTGRENDTISIVFVK